MASGVKPTRRYDSPRRREQAAATRREILAAARTLFERDGYASTTMAAIAREAGVALKTVYVAFETKSGVLRALWHLLLRGDEDDVPINDRRWYQEVLAEPDPERQIRLGAHNARLVKERVGGIFAVIRDAASGDPDIGALWKRIQAEFHANQRRVIASVAEKGALRPELDVDRATDVLWTLNHPSTWLLLVGERGWSGEAYEAWLADTVCAQLLRAPSGAS